MLAVETEVDDVQHELVVIVVVVVHEAATDDSATEVILAKGLEAANFMHGNSPSIGVGGLILNPFLYFMTADGSNCSMLK